MSVIERALRPLRRRLQSLASRSVLTGCDDSGSPQRVQVEVLAGEVRDLIQRVQQYGFHSVPEAGAYPVVLLCPYGDRAQAIALVVDDLRSRPSGGEPGDVALYDKRGNRVSLKDGVLQIEAAADLEVQVTGAATLTVGAGVTLNVTGNAAVNVSGNATLTTGGTLALGGAGGQPVARVGDSVVAGVITSGSAKVRAV